MLLITKQAEIAFDCIKGLSGQYSIDEAKRVLVQEIAAVSDSGVIGNGDDFGYDLETWVDSVVDNRQYCNSETVRGLIEVWDSYNDDML